MTEPLRYQLTDWFMDQNKDDPVAALEHACLYIQAIEDRVSGGFVRAKPMKKARPPKPAHVPVDKDWPNVPPHT